MSLAADLLAGLDPVVVFRGAFGHEPHAWQLDYLREQRNATVLKGRQVGASLGAAGLAISTAIYRANSLSAIVSPSLKQSSEITTRARAGLRNLGVPLAQDSASMLRLANGSRILSLPGTPTSVRGWAADLLILDEASYLDPETIIAARALTAATNGRTLVQSTPAGESGTFFELVRANDPTWAHFVVRSDSVPNISPEWLAGERRNLAADRYAAEYECQFGRTGPSLFSADRIASLILQEPA